MPTYPFRCLNCKKDNDVLMSIKSYRNNPTCPKCNEHMTRLWTGYSHPGPDYGFKPYWSEHLTSKPGRIFIDSLQTKKRLIKENHLIEAG